MSKVNIVIGLCVFFPNLTLAHDHWCDSWTNVHEWWCEWWWLGVCWCCHTGYGCIITWSDVLLFPLPFIVAKVVWCWYIGENKMLCLLLSCYFYVRIKICSEYTMFLHLQWLYYSIYERVWSCMIREKYHLLCSCYFVLLFHWWDFSYEV